MTKRPSLAGNMRALQQDTTPKPDALMSKREPEPQTVTPPPVAPPVERQKKEPLSTSRKPDRYAGKRMVLAPVDPDIHKELRLIVIHKGKGYTLEKAVQDALAEFVRLNKPS